MNYYSPFCAVTRIPPWTNEARVIQLASESETSPRPAVANALSSRIIVNRYPIGEASNDNERACVSKRAKTHHTHRHSKGPIARAYDYSVGDFDGLNLARRSFFARDVLEVAPALLG